MRREQINRTCGRTLIVLSVVALAAVVSGYFQSPQPDEGAGAHIFQLSMVAALLASVVFVASADLKKPSQSARPLALPALLLVLAFAALYYLEHYFYARPYH